ncbi:MAG: hypothetical protein PWP31_1180 [Clostridia bacterium]|nr:hypothetical protein [Clostridia bacterium]
MVVTALRLFGYRSDFKIVIKIGVIYGIAIWIVRGIWNYYQIPISLLTHTLVLMVIFSFLLKTIGKITWNNAIRATLINISLLLLSDFIILPPLLNFIELDMTNVFNNPWMHILIGYIENIFLLLLLFLNVVFGFKFSFNIEKEYKR